ncbi:hypothetical protein AA310_00655 [Arthrobacter sp. YC-RL1]|nr:hypothetical protein AA310_00655 [Arthrobacter sp. YC-RL1]
MAACKDYKFEKGEPDPWFPTSEAPTAAVDGQRICGTCPVLLTCRDYAFTANIQHGTLGGMTAKERINQVRRQRRPRQTKPKGKKPCSS